MLYRAIADTGLEEAFLSFGFVPVAGTPLI